MLILRGLLGSLKNVAIVTALLILPAGLAAGEWGWVRGWQYAAAYGVTMLIGTVVMGLTAPASLEARLRPPASTGQPKEDKRATAAVLGAFTLFLVFLPLDALVWQMLGPVPDALALAGLVLSVAGLVFAFWTLIENSFAIPVVEDQSDAGQTLIDTGPYALVRHPMYLGMLVMLFGMGMWLQSMASLPMMLVPIAAFAYRIAVEERVLLRTLPGYDAYQAERPYRLVPYFW